MNHIYKVVWSKTTNSLVVVSELASSQGKAASVVSKGYKLSSVFKKSFQLTALSALLISVMPAAQAAIAVGASTVTNWNGAVSVSLNGASATGASVPYNYHTPNNENYPDQGNNSNSSNIYSGTLSAAQSIAIGINATSQSGSIALGDNSRATGGLSLALGAFSQTNQAGAIALGTSALASGFNSFATMRQAAATADFAIAMGTAANANATNSIAMGSSALALGNQSIAIGSAAMEKKVGSAGGESYRTDYVGTTNTKAQGDRTIAFGVNTSTTSNDSIAIGSNSKTNAGTGAIAIGWCSSTSYQDSVAIGSNATANGGYSLALGYNATSTNLTSISIGWNAAASNTGGGHSQGAVAIGPKTTALGNQSVVLGASASAVEQATAIGNDSKANGFGSIVIGGDDTGYSRNPNSDPYTPTALGGERIGYLANTATGDNSNYRSSLSSGIGSVVVGVHGQALSNGSTAIGVYSTAGDNGITFTNDTTSTTAIEATAIGALSRAKSIRSSAIGYSAEALGNYSTVVGANSTANGTSSLALGHNSTAYSTYSLAAGYNASANLSNSTAIGSSSNASGLNAIALGTGAQALNTNTISIGTGNIVSGENSGAIGDPNNITGSNSYALGNNNVIYANNSFAVGNSIYISDTAQNTLAFGTNISVPTSTKTNNTLIGTSAKIQGGESSIAFGTNATVSNSVQSSAIAIGNQSKVEAAVGGIAIGNGSTISSSANNGSIALGQKTNVTGVSSIALGNNASVTGTQQGSVAIGNNTNVTNTGQGTVAVGSDTNVTVGNAVAIGDHVNVKGQRSIAIGSSSNVAEGVVNATTIGTGSNVTQNDGTAVGYNAIVSNYNGLALGANATSTAQRAVALGADSVAGREGWDQAAYDPYIPANANTSQSAAITATKATNNYGAVSVGSDTVKRQIINVAAGSADSDAVNVAQLKAAIGSVNTSWNIQENGTQKDIVNAGDNVSFANGTGTTANVSVDSTGKTSTVKYSVNKSGLSVATDGTVTAAANGDNFATAEQVAKAINDSEKTTTVEKGSDKVSVTGTTTGTKTNYVVDLSNAAKSSLDKADSALQSWTAQVNGANAKVVNQTNNTVNFVNGTNTIVKADANGNISVSTTDNVTFNTVNASSFNAGNISIGTNGINAGNTTITNVANGTNASDAVNVSQLNATNANVTNNTQNITNNTAAIANNTANISNNTNAIANNTQNITKNAADIQSTKDGLNATNATVAGNTANITNNTNAIANNTAAINKGINFGNGTTANNFALGSTINVTSDSNIEVSTVADGVKLALASSIAVDNLTANNSVKVGNVALTQAGINAGNHAITNVTNGTNATDAVNLSQLNASKSSVEAGDNVAVTSTSDANGTVYTVNANTSTVSNGSDKVTVTSSSTGNHTTNYAVDLSEAAKSSLNKADSALQSWTAQVNGVDAKVVNQTNNTVNFVNGTNTIVKADANGNISVSTADNVTFNTVNASTFNAGNVSISNSGINAGNTTITNVANGTQDSDAVNLSQLNATNANVTNNTNNIANNTQNITNVTNLVNQGFNIGADNGADDNVKLGEKVDFNGDGNIVTTVTNNAIAFALSHTLNLTGTGSVTMGDTVVNGSGMIINNGSTDNQTVSLTKDGLNNGGNTITGVANGSNATDAVNLSQLNAGKSSVEAGDNVAVTSTSDANGTVYTVNANTSTVSNGSDKVTVTQTDAGNHTSNYAVDLSDAAKASLDKADSALQSLTTSADGTKAQTLDKDNSNANFISGSNIRLTPSADGITIATAENVTFTNVNTTNFKAGDVTINSTGIDAGNHTITNVAKGVNATDAVNLAQLESYVGDNSYNWNLSDGTNNNAVPDNSTVAIKGSANADSANTSGIVTELNGTNVSVDLSNKTKADIQQGVDANTTVNTKGITFAADSGTATERKLGETLAINGDGDLINTTVSAGKVEVAASDKLKDAVNNATTALQSWMAQVNGADAKVVNQTNNTVNFVNGTNTIVKADANGNISVSTADNVTFNTVNASSFNAGNISIGTNGINAGNTTITNVANGTNASDAVNVSQLNATNANVMNNTQNITSVTNLVNQGFNIGADNGTDDNVKLSEKVDFNGDGNIVTTVTNNAIAFALSHTLNLTDTGSVTIGDTVVNSTGMIINNGSTDNQTVSLTKDGLNNGGNTITGVANGSNATDAVNLSQLNASKSSVEAGDNVAVTSTSDANGTVYTVNANTSTVSNGSDKVTVTSSSTGNHTTNYALDLSDAAKASLDKADSALQSLTTSADGAKAQTLDKDNSNANFISGSNIRLTPSADGITIATAENVTFTNVNTTNFKAGDVTINSTGIDAGNHTITNVAAGTNKTDAVNLGQLEQFIGDNSYNWNLSDGTNSSAVADNSTVAIEGSANGDSANTSGIVTMLDGTNVSVDLSDKAKVSLDKADSALQSWTAQVNGADAKVVNQTNNTVNFVNGTNTIVKADANGNISVSTADNVTFNTVNASTFNAGNVSISNNGINAGNTTITNVANGTNASDAVNVSQLNATNANVTNNTNNIANNTQNITNVTNLVNQGFNIGADNGADDNVKLGEKVDFNGDSNIVTTVTNNAIAFALSHTLNLTDAGSVTMGDTVVNSTGMIINNGSTDNQTVSLTKDGLNNGGNTITGVANGSNATDAVNLSQLNAGKSSVEAGDNVAVTSTSDANGTVYTVNANTSTVSNGSNKITVTQTDAGNHTSNYAVDLSDAAKASLDKADNALQSWTAQVNGADAKVVNQTNNTVNFVNGTNTIVKADANGNISVSTADNVTFNTVNASTFNAGDVSFNTSGINAGNHTITNVANGSNASDAVNVAQLEANTTRYYSVNSTVAGNRNNDGATGINAMAAGANAVASGDNATAIGQGTKANSAAAIAIGNNANATSSRNDSVIAIGNNAQSTGSYSIAVGTNSVANHTWSMAMGISAKAIDDYATALGSSAQATSQWTTALGAGANATGSAATAVGSNTTATAGGATVVGYNSSVTGANTTALGNNINVDTEGSVVLGNGSAAASATTETTATVNNLTYSGFAGADNVATGDYVSVGSVGEERQIKNVAAGNVSATSTDAINGSQLYATQNVIGNVANSVVNNFGGNATVDQNGNITFTDIGGTGANTIHDAIQNVSNVAKMGWNVQANGDTATKVAPGDTVQFINGQNIEIDRDGTNITVATANNVTFTNVNTTTLTAGPVTINSRGIDAGNHTITNVAKGVNATDAVNLAQLESYVGDNSYNWNLSDGNNSSAVADNSTVAITGSANGDSANTSGIVTELNGTNVSVDLSNKTKADIQQGVDANTTVNTKGITFAADSGTATERKLGETLAINGDGDLINTTVSAGKVEVAASDKLKDAVNNATTALQSWTAQVNGTDAKVVDQTNNTVNFVNGNNINITNNNGTIKVATTDNVTFNTVNASTFNAGGVSISNSGINAGNTTITNVANGTQDSDAVNLSQLNATNANVTNNTNNIANNTQNITNVTNLVNQGFNIGADNGADDNVKLGEKVDFNGDGNIVTTVTNNAIAFALSHTLNLTGTGSVTMGDTVVNGSGMIINNGSTDNQTVSLTKDGLNNGGNTITGVANGSNATDAVNLSQLNAGKSSVEAGDNVAVTSTSDANGTVYTVNANTSTVSNGSDKVTVTQTDAGNHTSNYAVDLSDAAKASLDKADSALQSLTTSADGTKAQTLDKDNSNANFISGSNIRLTPSADGITIATAENVTFTNVNTTNFKAGDVTINSTGIDAGNHTITNVAKGVNATDAVNLAQLESYVGDNSYNWNLSDGTNNNAVPDNSTVAIKGSANADSANTSGIVTELNGTNVSVDLSNKTKADIQQGVDANTTVNTKGITFAADSGTATERKLGETLAINGDGDLINTTVSAGKVEVAASDKLKGAVNNATTALQSWTAQVNGAAAKVVDQTNNTVNFVDGNNINITNNNGTIKVATTDNVTFNTVNASTFNAGGVSISNSGINAGNTTITNVANGTQDSDAVNLSQLNATNANVTNNTNNIANNTANITNNTNAIASNTAMINKGINFGNGTDANKFNLGDTINVTSDSNIVVSTVADGVKLALASSIAVNNITVNDTFKAGDVTINSTGIDAGNHTITNVAKGVNATDAVNLSQLESYVGDNSYNWNLSDGTNNNAVADNSTVTITGSANGDSANTSGIVTELNGTNVSVDLSNKTKADIQQGVDANTTVNTKGITFAADSGTATERKLGETLAINGDGDLINTTVSAGKVEVAASDKLKGAVNNATTALQSWTAQVNGADAKVVNQTNNTVNFVNGTNTIVKADANGNISVSTADNVTFNTVNASTFNAGNVSISNSGINAGNHTITNVSNGTKDSDAVNLSQLNATNANVTNNTNNIANNTKNITNVTNLVNQGFNIGADNGTDDNVKLGEKVDFNGDGNIVTTVTNNAIAFALSNTLNLTDAGSVTMGDTVVNGSGMIINNGSADNQTVSLTKDGLNNGGNTITNVAIGSNATDAVNLSQLNASKSSVEAGDNVAVTSTSDANGTVYTVNANSSTVSNGSDKITVTQTDAGNHTSNYAVDLSEAAKSSLNKADSALQSWTAQVNGTDAKVVNQTNNTVNFVNGTNTIVKADANGNISVSTADNVTFNTVNASTFNAGGVSISNSGINAGNTTITNVANGTQDSDAVNLSQLNATNANVTNNTQNITNNTAAIANNTANISNNTNAIANNTQNITKNAADIQSTKDGLNATNATVAGNTANITNNTNAIANNTATINKGINFGNGTTANNFALGSTINVTSDSNIEVSTVADGVKLALASSIAVDNLTANNSVKVGNVALTQAGINAGNHAITNVTNGTNATDAVNVQQLTNAVNNASSGSAWKITENNDATNAKTVGNSTVSFNNGSNTIAVVNGTNVTYNLADNITLTNAGSVTIGNTMVNNDGIKVGNETTISNGSATIGSVTIASTGKISGVAKGTLNAASTEAVNGSQLYETNQNVSNLTAQLSQVNQTANAGWKLAVNGTSTSTVAPNATVSLNNSDNNVVITKDANSSNVTFGLNSTLNIGNGANTVKVDGTNGSISTGNTTITGDNVKTTTLTTGNTTINNDGLVTGNVTVKQDGINAGGNKITGVADGDISANSTDAVNGGQLYNVIQNATAGVKTEVEAGKNIVVTNSTGANGQTVYTVETAKEVDFDKVTVGNVTINKDTNKVSGIANGDISATSSDAINGSQLYTANQNVADHLGGGSKVDENGNVTAPTYTVVTNPSTNATTTANNVGDAINGLNTAISKPLTFAADSGSNSEMRLGSTVSIKGGVSDSTKLSDNNIGVVSDGKGNLTVKLAKDISGLNSVTTGDTTMNSEGITINNGAAGSPVSLTKNGLNNGGNRITNVAPGEVSQDSTDAVNGSQLHATNQQVVRNAQAINQVANHVNKVDRNLRAGIAGAMAAGGLYHATLPGKSMVAAGVGTYRGESAIAVGYSRLSDNGKLGVKFSVNGNTRGDTGAAASVGYQW